jgi:hypothetical protein
LVIIRALKSAVVNSELKAQETLLLGRIRTLGMAFMLKVRLFNFNQRQQ